MVTQSPILADPSCQIQLSIPELPVEQFEFHFVKLFLPALLAFWQIDGVVVVVPELHHLPLPQEPALALALVVPVEVVELLPWEPAWVHWVECQRHPALVELSPASWLEMLLSLSGLSLAKHNFQVGLL